MEVMFFIIVLVIGAIVFGMKANNSPDNMTTNGDYEKALASFKSNGGYKISSEQLCKIVGVNAYAYYKNFIPDSEFLTKLSIGGGAEGLLRNISTVVGKMNRAATAGSLGGGFATRGFIAEHKDINPQLNRVLTGLAMLFSNGIINKGEFTKGVASILYCEGTGITDACEFDSFGEAKFSNNNDRLILAMVYQFFRDNTVTTNQVEQLLESKISKLPQNMQQELATYT